MPTTIHHMCGRCGQVAQHAKPLQHWYVCDACRERERAPQGETVRLFQPAPNVMPGQLDWQEIVDTTC